MTTKTSTPAIQSPTEFALDALCCREATVCSGWRADGTAYGQRSICETHNGVWPCIVAQELAELVKNRDESIRQSQR